MGKSIRTPDTQTADGAGTRAAALDREPIKLDSSKLDIAKDVPAPPPPPPPRLDEFDQPRAAKPQLASTLMMVLLFLMTLGFAALAAYHAPTLGWPALILLGGMAVMAFIAFLISRADRRTELRSESPENIYVNAFWRDPEPSIIIRGGKVVRANRAYEYLAKSLGVKSEGGLPPTVDRLFADQRNETAPAIFRLHHMGEETSFAEEIVDTIGPSGRHHRYHLRVTALQGGQLWTITDLANSVSGAATALTHAPVGLFSVDREGKVLAMNSVLERWLGVDKSPAPDFMREFIESPETLLESPPVPGRIVRADTRLITRKGLVSPTVMVGSWRELDTGEIIASVGLYGHSSLGAPANPVLARRLAAAKAGAHGVAQPSAKAGLISGSDSALAAPFGILKLKGSTLAESMIVSANHAFDRMAEGQVWTGNDFAQIINDNADSREFLSLPAGDCEPEKAYEAFLFGDRALPVSIYIVAEPGDPLVSWAYLVDISARKSLEDQLVQSQKMQAIGQLAAGVAHDFNNLLTAIRLNTDELLGRHPVGDPSYPELQKINSTVSRAAGLVKKLLAFSRRQTRRAERVDVTETLSDMVVTLKQTIGERVKLNVVHGRGLPPILADKTQIDTVLMNLCVNARDAMAEQGGGTITIRSSERRLEALDDSDPAEKLKAAKGEHFVCIEVSDTGTGMPDEVKAKIFEPFFTTKEVGKGTGLGLATVYGIVEQSGGAMSVDSTMGVGTSFRLYFPVADENFVPEVLATPKAAAGPRPPSNLAGQGTILFVEDEDSVRVIAAKTLRKRGYKVIEACDGDEAFEILEDGEEVFDLMISDVVMPGMDGPTLLKKARAMLGEARIVFISGYAKEEFSDLLSEEPDVTFLPKPFTLAQLAEKVKAEIGESNDDYY